MKKRDLIFTASDRKNIFVNQWVPDRDVEGVLVVAHGMSEHGLRYAGFAQALAARGWTVVAPDHRGHGKTAAEGQLGWFSEHDGFRRVVDDIRDIVVAMQSEYDGAPVAIFGHCFRWLLSCLCGSLRQGPCGLRGDRHYQ